MKTKTWLRLYHEFADDPKIQMLAFEDQRHYVMVLCLKGRGVLDSGTPSDEYRERMIAKALGLDPLTAREVKFRLLEPGLIDVNWQPVKWAERQFESDSSTERVQKHRAERKRFGNVSSKQEAQPDGQTIERAGNVSVTAQIRSEQRENSPSGNSLDARVGTRAGPTGPGSAPAESPKPAGKKGRQPEQPEPATFDENASRSFWWNHARSHALTSAAVFGICPPRPTVFDDIPDEAPTYARGVLLKACGDAATWAVDQHRAKYPLSPEDGKAITAAVESRLKPVLEKLTPEPMAKRIAPTEAA